MPIQFDDSNWPVVICRAVGHSTDDDIETYTRVLKKYLERGERHVVIVDARGGDSLRSRHRRMVAEWNKKNERALSLHRAALILVTPSTLLRGMITAVYWLFPAPFPYQAVETMSQGLRQADQMLRVGTHAHAH